MATVLNFKRNEYQKARQMPKDHIAEVVFFTGVRYERMNPQAQAIAAQSKQARRHGTTTTV